MGKITYGKDNFSSGYISHVQLFATSRTVAHQVPLSMAFSRQEYWSGYHSLFQEILPTQGSNPSLLHCRQILYHLSYPGSSGYVSQHKTIFHKAKWYTRAHGGKKLLENHKLVLFIYLLGKACLSFRKNLMRTNIGC